jgi:hypothetical protein
MRTAGGPVELDRYPLRGDATYFGRVFNAAAMGLMVGSAITPIGCATGSAPRPTSVSEYPLVTSDGVGAAAA